MKKSNDVRLIASAKPGNPVVFVNHFAKVHNRLFIQEYDTEPIDEMKEIKRLIRSMYEENQKYVQDLFFKIYGRSIKFKETLSDLLIKIKNIVNQAGESIENIIDQIRSYLGYSCSFLRREGQSLVLCNSERILNAYKLVKEKKSFITVENVLYL